MTDQDAQRIEDWGVIADSRLMGNVFNRPGHADGARIVTSPVIEVRLMGEGWSDHYAVAFTESGTVYRLGQPSPSFGVKKADQFVYGKLRAIHPTAPHPNGHGDSDGTMVGRSVETMFLGIEHIDVYESTFRPR